MQYFMVDFVQKSKLLYDIHLKYIECWYLLPWPTRTTGNESLPEF